MKRTSALVAALLLSAAPAFAEDMTVDKIEGKNLYDANGKNIANLDEVVIGPDKKLFAVIEYGGFLGLGAEERLLPIEELSMKDGKFVSSRSGDDLKGLQTWKDGQEGFSEVEDSFVTPIQVSDAAPANPPAMDAAPVTEPTTPPPAPEAPPAVTPETAPMTPPAQPQ